MKPFTYVVPKSLAEAKDAARQPDTLVKGAGLDIIDRMKERLQTPARVVNVPYFLIWVPYCRSELAMMVAGFWNLKWRSGTFNVF